MNLSVAMIVKNEERHIRRALRSVCEADEIVILDTGSTDNTEKIVTSLGWPNVRYVKDQYVWCDNFAEARNVSIDLCTNDWVLILDADDRMVEDAIFEIKSAIEKEPEACSLRLKVSSEKSSFHLFRPQVLRKSAGARYEGRVHEYIVPAGSQTVASEIIRGWSENHAKDERRNLRILQQCVEDEPDNARVRFYLAKELFEHKEFAEASKQFDIYVPMSRFVAELAEAYLCQAKIAWQMNDGDAARNWCALAVTCNANFREALCLMAEMSHAKNAVRWREFARLADNSDVLFVRPCSCR